MGLTSGPPSATVLVHVLHLWFSTFSFKRKPEGAAPCFPASCLFLHVHPRHFDAGPPMPSPWGAHTLMDRRHVPFSEDDEHPSFQPFYPNRWRGHAFCSQLCPWQSCPHRCKWHQKVGLFLLNESNMVHGEGEAAGQARRISVKGEAGCGQPGPRGEAEISSRCAGEGIPLPARLLPPSATGAKGAGASSRKPAGSG